MKIHRFLIATVIVSLVVMGYFGWRYMFDPKGIYIADGEVCTSNETKLSLVFSVESKPGSKVIALLEPSDQLCAPSSVAKPAGEIRVGETEDEMECVYAMDKHGKYPFLSAYLGKGNCDWGFLSR